jgi:hypothetical protein
LLPDNFEKLFNEGDNEFTSIFQFILVDNPFHKLNYTIKLVSYTASKIINNKKGKQIGERSIQELVGATVEEFKQAYFHKTMANTTPHILVFKITFDSPWYVSVN